MADPRATTLAARAAVAAWAVVRPAGAPYSASSATTVKPFRGGSVVYRLAGVAPGARDVIAKRTSRTTVEFESRLYADVLTRLAVPTVRCYGIAPDADEAMAWLFMEDAGGIPYAPEQPEHRRLAARWLAGLHAAAAGRSAPATLSMRDAAHYRDLLERCCRRITAGLCHPALTAGHRTSLRAVARRSEMLLDRWPAVERICAALLPTLVHADFVAKNVRITDRPSGRTLIAFDWENAGWGPPAIDLPSVDLDEYARELGGGRPVLARSELLTIARIGRIFWFASCVEWESWAMGSESVWRLAKNMPVYERDVTAVMAELGWA